jgi:hypothetical protein
MKQGRASRDVKESWKQEPNPKAVNPRGVSQIGTVLGNKSTDKGKILNPIEQVFVGKGFKQPAPKSSSLYDGRGYNAPLRSQNASKGGSQGSY